MPDSVPVPTPDTAASVVGAVRTRLENATAFLTNYAPGTEPSQALADALTLLALVDELTAQRDLARDAAVALEQELAERGRCGDLAPTLAGGDALPVCDLPAGHDGWHKADDGCEWSHGSAVLGLGLQPETSEQ